MNVGRIYMKVWEWVVKNNILNILFGDLFKIFRLLNLDLLKDFRIFLCIEISYNIMKICGGEYFYFGLFESMIKYIKNLFMFFYEIDIYLKF